jgi:hypothetical protein
MKRQQKIYIAAGIAIVLLVAGWRYGSVHFSDYSLCSNEVASELASPDNEYLAVVFERSCGATTGLSTQVSVLKNNSSLENEPGNVAIIDGHPKTTGIGITWADQDVLLVKGVGDSRFFKKLNQLKLVRVRYVQ